MVQSTSISELIKKLGGVFRIRPPPASSLQFGLTKEATAMPRLNGAPFKNFSVRIPDELHARAVALAASRRRSLAQEVLTLLERETAQEAAKAKPAE
jgi:hypothetical protein